MIKGPARKKQYAMYQIFFYNCCVICNFTFICSVVVCLSFPLLTVFFLFSTVAPSQSPSLPHSNSHGGSGIFSFSPANMVHAVKQKSAFFPVMRPGSGYSPPMASTLPNGWAQTMINVSIFSYK